MTTHQMLKFMKDQGYPLTLLSAQSGVGYYKLYRHQQAGGALTNEEKAAVWRFAMCQPALEERLLRAARRENTMRDREAGDE